MTSRTITRSEPSQTLVTSEESTRPGRTNDILDLISGTNEEQKSYVKGLVITSCVIFGVFLVWALVLFGFKCLGRKRVGFLAGYPIRKPKTTDKNEEGVELEKAPIPLDNDESCHAADKDIAHGVPYSEKEGESILAASEEDENAQMKEAAFKSQSKGPSDEIFDNEFHDEENEVSAEPDEQEQAPMELASKDELDPDALPNASQDADGVHDEGFHDEASEVEMSVSVNKEAVRTKRLLVATRSIVLFCCVGIITASVLFSVEGADALVKTLDSTLEGIQQVEDVADRGIVLIDSFLYNQQIVINSTKRFLENHESWCPNKRDEILEECLNSTENLDPVECNLSAIPLQDELDDIASFIKPNGGIIYDEATSLRSDLEEISDIADNMYNTAQNFNWAFYVSAAFVVLLDLVVLVFMYGVVQAWREKQTKCFRCVRMTVLIPLLLIFMFFGWLFAIVFLIGAMTTADFCVDSPDEPSIAVVEAMQDRFGSIVFTYVIYLLEGCGTVNLLSQSIESEFFLAVEILKAVHRLVTGISTANVENIQETCGVDVTPIASLATLIDEQFHVIVKLLFQIRVFFSCANFRPIYESLMYDAVCYSGVKGLTWIFSTQLAIAILSMIIATLRGSCSNSEEKDLP